jgi:hypothetical protein
MLTYVHNNIRTARQTYIADRSISKRNGDVVMANSNSTNSTKTKSQSQNALDRFKMEVASEIGVNLKDGYNGDLTSAEAGSVGGNMVKKMIQKQEEQMSSGN